MKKTIGFAAVICLSGLLYSCGDGAYTKTDSGMEYKIISDKKDSVAAYGDVLKFHVTNRYKDSLRDHSYDKMPYYQQLDSMQLRDYYEVFAKLRKRDSLVIRILTDSFFKSGMGMMPKEFKKGEYLITTIKVLDIFKQDAVQADQEKEIKSLQAADSIKAITQKVEDDKLLNAYFEKNNIKAQKTEKGTYYEIQKAGGEPAKEGQMISVKYTGKLLDGTTFDSNVDSSFNHTDPYNLVIGAGGSIEGFDDGLRNFGKGTVGRLFIPSTLAYGPRGQNAIKPNSNLIFEIEVLDVKETQ
ncbi:MAG: FKBP-type peptidyl-prolyl cis-trans isomerase [Chitinophagaceae bacterium]|nr:FKBP-type peptidyl-prolyl cis-trans isomerase [Chitinophagaceae bacterium]MCW5926986.1 FKBP-type peptidyl-prolyl cis-trans isomerase [Chitinophagaceae bacterium]